MQALQAIGNVSFFSLSIQTITTFTLFVLIFKLYKNIIHLPDLDINYLLSITHLIARMRTLYIGCEQEPQKFSVLALH